LIETIAAEARQVFQAERKVQLQIFFEAMLLGIVSTLYARDFVSAAVSGGMSSGRSFP